MTGAEIMEILKINLGIANSVYDDLLKAQLAASREYIAAEGITLDTDNSIGDAYLLTMYAAWLYKKRESNEAMPRMLRRQLNNKIFGQVSVE